MPTKRKVVPVGPPPMDESRTCSQCYYWEQIESNDEGECYAVPGMAQYLPSEDGEFELYCFLPIRKATAKGCIYFKPRH